MPHYPKPPPPIIDGLEAAELLPKFVWPLATDRAIVGSPLGGNRYTNGVSIQIKNDRVTLTTDQYEKLRTQVVLPIMEQYLLKPFDTNIDVQEIERQAKLLIEQVFADD